MTSTSRLLLAFLLLPMTALAEEWTYTVRPGDNPWNITERYLKGIGYWKPLVRLNNISQPKRIPPGTKLRMPLRWSKVRAVEAQVVAVQGEVEVIRNKTGSSRLAEAGLRLNEDDQLETGPESNLLLEFADGTQLLVSAETTLSLGHLQGYGDGDVTDTRLHMDKGRSETLANPHKRSGTRFEISTPSAITAVRGTGFRVTSDTAGKQSRVEVTEGRVAVAGAGKSRSLRGGFGLVTKQGEPPQAPVKLLPAPNLKSMPDIVEEPSFTFKPDPLDGAAAYRVQVSGKKQLGTLLFDGRFPGGTIRVDVSNLLDGIYRVKVRAIDGKELEGLEASRAFELNARPAAPFLSAPAAGGMLLESRPLFRWARPEESASYHFQLAGDQQMSNPVLDETGLTEEELNPAFDLPPGQYYWQVTAYDGLGKAGPAGYPQPFRILPKAPDAAPPVIDDAGLLFQWRPGAADQRYGFQLAWDEEFSQIIVESELDEARYQLASPEPGIYYSRVKTIDGDGVSGPYGPYQRIEIKGPPPDLQWLVISPFLLLLLL